MKSRALKGWEEKSSHFLQQTKEAAMTSKALSKKSVGYLQAKSRIFSCFVLRKSGLINGSQLRPFIFLGLVAFQF